MNHDTSSSVSLIECASNKIIEIPLYNFESILDHQNRAIYKNCIVKALQLWNNLWRVSEDCGIPQLLKENFSKFFEMPRCWTQFVEFLDQVTCDNNTINKFCLEEFHKILTVQDFHFFEEYIAIFKPVKNAIQNLNKRYFLCNLMPVLINLKEELNNLRDEDFT